MRRYVAHSISLPNLLSFKIYQIDWEESSYAGRICVRPNIDEELDHWKHIYNGIDGVLVCISSLMSLYMH